METDSVIITEQSRQPRNNALWDIVNGSIAGALGKTIEYPFDTVKVRLQTQGAHLFPTTWSCIRYTYQREGVLRGFFQGIGSPICGAAVENAVLFVSYNQCAKLLDRETNFSSLQKIVVSGAFAGSCASLVLTPVELIKCRLQVSNLASGKPTKIIPTIKSVLQERGVLGLWQGQSGTLIRELFGGITWFSTYELMKGYLLHRHEDGGADGKSTTWELLVSGASAGLAFNASIFPADTLKSKMQTEQIGLFSCARKIMAQAGLGGFYRGLGITLARAVPANAVVFYTYETLSKM
ncbi:ORT1 (YOR130C) [Zygosaccharomyces parabailii]|uniref:ZYBA0S05-05402g1_1 n=1 Tax=Zygosaccharomyces bailii (strain CLIB 213 / ATCC 58445 / CBS 680 / BCRC 21525 / NBRC 1098 / NCYC 1416 / NRRL Y-2227) TaxID=1333698 RepID=A0A8J2T758_ZYGB2|nr:ORT1 (YOR130C) [Zygosaccharomyces parabailii]CDF89947.1 ZYBA0S05-05402g1_1 [Zygosaccharomyces bailii CLIB 213]CDH17704.1 probable Mitochondrial ornithine transporter 1 [Zygosaccharomyces bailii ISA1307]SJM84384.1 probable Mitochondrial ornithine transporter 1 [Zygosaccharomyces bailii]